MSVDDDDLTALLEALEAVCTVEVDDRPDANLVQRLGVLWRARSILDSALCRHVAAVHSRGAAAGDGAVSTQAWLRGRLRVAPGAAANLVRVAQHLRDLPETGKALGAGEISLDHAGVIAHLADAVGAERLGAGQQILLDQSRVDHPGNVRRAAKHLRILLDGDEADGAERRRYEGRYLSIARTFQGMVAIDGLLDPVGGETVLAAITAATAPPRPGDDRSAQQRRADALVDICGRVAACGDLPTSGGIRPQVAVTVELAALIDGAVADPSAGPQVSTGPQVPTGPQVVAAGAAGWSGPPRRAAVLGSGEPIGPGMARMLACDAGVVPVVLGSASEPLDIGRRARVVPAGLRRALALRDGQCRWPGCDRPSPWCDAHHLVAWSDHGRTSLDNLILLCRHHHTLAHHGWRVFGSAGGIVTVTHPSGRRVDLARAEGGPSP